MSELHHALNHIFETKQLDEIRIFIEKRKNEVLQELLVEVDSPVIKLLQRDNEEAYNMVIGLFPELSKMIYKMKDINNQRLYYLCSHNISITKRILFDAIKDPEFNFYSDLYDYESPLEYACYMGFTEIIEYFIENKKEQIQLARRKFEDLFGYAFHLMKIEIIVIMVKSGLIDINKPVYELRSCFLHACFLGNLELVEFIFKAGADVRAVVEEEDSCLTHVCNLTDYECKLQHPDKIESKDAMDFACGQGHLNVVKYLVEKVGFIINKESYLYNACIGKRLSLVDYLVSNWAKPEGRIQSDLLTLSVTTPSIFIYLLIWDKIETSLIYQTELDIFKMMAQSNCYETATFLIKLLGLHPYIISSLKLLPVVPFSNLDRFAIIRFLYTIQEVTREEINACISPEFENRMDSGKPPFREPKQVKREICGFLDRDREIFAMVILLSDDYLKLNLRDRLENSKKQKSQRFLSILRILPIELQSHLCKGIYSVKNKRINNFYNTKEVESSVREEFKIFTIRKKLAKDPNFELDLYENRPPLDIPQLWN